MPKAIDAAAMCDVFKYCPYCLHYESFSASRPCEIEIGG